MNSMEVAPTALQPMQNTDGAQPVDTVVIMPVFGQASFMGEALASVLAQDTESEFRIVMVDDCCPDENTSLEARKAARARPDKIHYIHSASNRGLSVVRNTGINYAFQTWPELFSILFFDGDDRMHSKLVDRSIKALRSANEADGRVTESGAQVGWVFEDPDHFGMDGLIKRVHQYSSLFSMAGCANTSSSMILGDLFRSGLRYSETMLGGGEDWSFWLDALKSGYRGKYFPRLGFQYRRRPGSMAYHALKGADMNRATIRQSHAELFSPDFYLSEEQSESPRYALFTADAIPSTISAGRQITFPSVQSLVEMIIDYENCPTQPLPQYVMFSSAICFQDLDREKLLDWCLWRLEAQAGSENVITTRFVDKSDEGLLVDIGEDRPYSTGAKNGELFCVSTDKLIQISRHHNSLDSCVSKDWYRGANVGSSAITGRSVYAEFELFLADVRSKYRYLTRKASQHGLQSWKPFGLGRPQLSHHFFGATPLVALQDGQRSVLCIVRDTDVQENVDLVEKVNSFASTCRAAGLSPALLAFGSQLTSEFAESFDRVFVCRDKMVNRKQLPDFGREALAGLMLPFAGVVSFGTTEYAADMNQLRRFRRDTCHVHFRSYISNGLPNTDLVNCFKVYTNVLCISESDVISATALGVSPEQIVTSDQQLVDIISGLQSEQGAPVF